ncbi:cystatin-like [Ascaphus truei]|uniref:cystatin-like n=1 Tax=Ascaphus truei TaxID=8439 RepID=UPI003F5A8DBE
MAVVLKVFVVLILATFTQVIADRQTRPQLLGGWRKAKEDDKGIQMALQFAMTEYNKESNDMYISKVHRIISLKKQVVAGMRYLMTVEVITTSCEKSKYTMENCPNSRNTSTITRCTFEVLSVPWQKITELRQHFCI